MLLIRFYVLLDINKWLEDYDKNNNDDESEDESDDDNCSDTLDNEDEAEVEDESKQSEENLFNSVTCLLPEEPLNDVIGKM